jgi:hypothetical protein
METIPWKLSARVGGDGSQTTMMTAVVKALPFVS